MKLSFNLEEFKEGLRLVLPFLSIPLGSDITHTRINTRKRIYHLSIPLGSDIT